MLRRSLARACVLAVGATAALTLPSAAATHPGPVRDLVRSARLALGDAVAVLHGERLIGVTWTSGTAAVRVRWHTAQGWSEWQTADQDTGASDVGRPGTEPLWRPPWADRVALQTGGRPQGLELVRVVDGLAQAIRGAVAQAATGRAALGEVESRAQWGADESLVRRAPRYASRVQAVVVHHTDNPNGYAPGDVPAMIRADYSYHVRSRGWDDLGYNLLVDQYGRVWEGRRGGLGRATIGAHAQGFNVGTLGVAMLGDLTRTTASPAAERALERVIAYAASSWAFDPTGQVRLRSQGSPRYADGRVVTLPRVFGHMDTGQTDCPGSLEGRLPVLRAGATHVLGPAPRIVRTALSGVPVRSPRPAAVRGTLTTVAPWTAVLRDPQGNPVATAHGTSRTPAVSWDGRQRLLGLPALPGTYTWQLRADDGYHPASSRSGTFEVALPALLSPTLL